MGACPFCKAEISADILTFGGRCPNCLIEIPGEEAPTDPGAEARAAREAEEAAAAKKPPIALIAGGLVVLLAAVGGGFAAMETGPEPLPDVPTGAEAYKKVSSQFVSIDLDSEPEPPPEPEPKKVRKTAPATAKATPKQTKKPVGSNLPDTSKLGTDDPGDIALNDAGDGRPAGLDAPDATRTDGSATPQVGSVMGAPSTSSRGLLDDDIGGGPRDRLRGEEYCGEAMRDPVKMIMKQLGTQLRTCGDRMLKKDEGFSSSVKVSVAIEKTGSIAAIDLRPSNTDDPEFLGCIEKTIKRTRFPRFCQGVDLAKTYYFGSQR